ncbi:DUF4255 domain-containing protein [Pleomorphovibrio marinus]|uniref:DUF4255 domain-containing protein n=1 Tax=Pleomorphovibrio marinus TaxID=2164132 RepID=UPI000E0C6B80|nr:DUF4255 domain-containing protein [Pleomorphovibrio marinus]
MIFEVFQILIEQVNRHFTQLGLTDAEVVMDNIAFVDGNGEQSEAMRDKVVLSLLNFQEEPSMKNFPNHRVTDVMTEYRNPVVNLHLFLLFSANRNHYSNALRDLGAIMRFFQGKRFFTQANTVFDREVSSMSQIRDFRFTVDLFSPSFEELNYIWGTLGGRQLPSVLYKLCLIPVQSGQVQGEGELIQVISKELKEQ